LIGLVAVVQVFVLSVAARAVAHHGDLFLAGRTQSALFTMFGMFATWFGAETCIGSSARVFSTGASSIIVDPLGFAVALFLTGFVFGPSLREAASKHGSVTVGGVLASRFSPWFGRLYGLLCLPSSILWAAAQIRSLQVVFASFNASSPSLITITIITLYTCIGGASADAINDVIQGSILIVGLIMLTYCEVSSHGISSSLHMAIDTHRTLATESIERGPSVEAFCVAVFGGFMSQEVVAKLMACHSTQAAQKSALVASVLYIVIGLLPALLGLLAHHSLGDHATSVEGAHEDLLPQLARLHFGSVGSVLFCSALISAVLTTIDSTLLAAASVLAHDVVLPFAPTVNVLWLGRGCVIVCGVLAYISAEMSESVFSLIEEAAAFGSSGTVCVSCFGLWSAFGGTTSAATAFLSGELCYLLGKYWLHLSCPYMLAIGVSFFMYVLCAVSVDPCRHKPAEPTKHKKH